MIPGADRIDIVLTVDAAGTVTAADVASSRAVAASRVLEGKAPEDALRLVPLLFALCGTAQQVAGLRAAEDALGMTPEPEEALARHLLVTAETVAEHATRMLVDWPKLAGLEPHTGPARAARTAAQAVQAALYPAGGRGVIGGKTCVDRAALRTAAETLEAGVVVALSAVAAVLDHAPEVRMSAAPAMPDRLDPAWLAARMEDATFLKMPTGPTGEVFETGPFARRPPAEAAAQVRDRLAARLAETWALAREIVENATDFDYTPTLGENPPAGLGGGRGLGAVEAARGRLVHSMEITGGRIARYRILAPTEWNFHPRGALGKALGGLTGAPAAEAERAARWMVAALDPCVACAVSTREAQDA